MRSSTYTRIELVRNLRNRRFLLFSLGFPLVLYFLIATPNRHEESLGGSGISAPLYFMVSLAAFGTMNAVVGTCVRIGCAFSQGPRCRHCRCRRVLVAHLVRAGVVSKQRLWCGPALRLRKQHLRWRWRGRGGR